MEYLFFKLYPFSENSIFLKPNYLIKLDETDKAMYLKHTDKIKDEIAFLQSELSQSSLIGLNLEKAVEKCLMIAQNLNNMWVTASFENKRRLQNVVFPEEIFFDKQKEEVRTEKMNSLFLSIPPLQRVIGENKKGNLLEDYLNAGKVPRTGILQ